MTSNTIAVRTKSGKKIHLAHEGSSRTFCGVRHAGRTRVITDAAQPCQGCGMHPDMTGATLREWLTK